MEADLTAGFVGSLLMAEAIRQQICCAVNSFFEENYR
jgi:hypothetical protein